MKIFLWKRRRFRLRWDSSPGHSIAGRMLYQTHLINWFNSEKYCFTGKSLEVTWLKSEKQVFTDESVKRQITDSISENLTVSDLESIIFARYFTIYSIQYFKNGTHYYVIIFRTYSLKSWKNSFKESWTAQQNFKIRKFWNVKNPISKN